MSTLHQSPTKSESDFLSMDDTTYARNRRDIAHQRVTQFQGFFIASYGYCIGELGGEYIGSYKICETRPESYWRAKTRLIGWCSHTEATSLAAMELAEATARQHILRSLLAPSSAQ